MWGNDADDRVIPVIPSPRTPADALDCCTRPKAGNDDQPVCPNGCGYDQPSQRGREAVAEREQGEGRRASHGADRVQCATALPREGDHPAGGDTLAEGTPAKAAPLSSHQHADGWTTQTARGAQSWQCSRCGRWFKSGQPSQVCPNCS